MATLVAAIVVCAGLASRCVGNLRLPLTFNRSTGRERVFADRFSQGEMRMLAPPADLLRAGFELKLNRVKRATQSYIRDRTRRATGSVTSYIVAAGLFAAAGMFLLAAVLVGLTALFRWVEIKYGLFPAFGVIGGLLLLLTIVCAGIAIVRLKRQPPQYPSLASRLRVAIAAPAFNTPSNMTGPGGMSQTATSQSAMSETAMSLAPKAARDAAARAARFVSDRKSLSVPVGLGVAALLVGWAAVRRRQQTR